AQWLQQLGVPEVKATAPVLVELMRDHQSEFTVRPSLMLRQMRLADVRPVAPALLEALKNPKADIRLQAATILARLGSAETQAAVTALIDALEESNLSTRLQACQALAKIGPEAKAAVPALVALLDDPQRVIFTIAGQALSQIRPDAVQAVLQTWNQEEWIDRPGVIQALGLFGPAVKAAVPKLVEAVKGSDSTIHGLASQALINIGADSVPEVCTLLAQGDPRTRQAAGLILSRLGSAAASAIPALTHALQDPDLPVRIQAAQALWDVDRRVEKVVPVLLEGLKDKDASLRRTCATVLSQIDPLPPLAIPPLQEVLKDPDFAVHSYGALSLCRVPGHMKETLPLLSAALQRRFLRDPIIDALGRAGAEAKDALPALLRTLQDDSTDTVLAGRIGSVIEQIAGSEGVEGLVKTYGSATRTTRPRIQQALAHAGPAGAAHVAKLLDDPDQAVRGMAIRILGRPGRETAEFVPALIKAVKDKDSYVRREAVRAMGQIGSPAQAAIPALKELLKSEPPIDRIAVAEALAYVEPHSPAAVSALVELVKEPDNSVRRQAIQALGRIGPKEPAVQKVLSEAVGSADAELRMDAALAMAYMGGQAKEVLPVLLDVIQTRNHPLRIRALEAVARLGPPSEMTLSALVRGLWEEGASRIKASEVLGRMGSAAKSAVPSLRELLKVADLDSRLAAAVALWKIDHQAAESVPALVAGLKYSATPVQRNALTLPGRFGTLSPSPGDPPCERAAEALGQIGSEARAAEPALTEAMNVPQFASCRPYYALALLKIDRQAAGVALPALVEVLDGKGPASRLSGQAAATLRKQTIAALGDLGAEARPAVPSLQKAKDTDPDEAVRTEAASALKKIGA
ncbi:MAG TPA: HEAT repeat domain-containing protein, partial [Gemmataceae bacterium]|nr:HEAT repeat domain-containing protein [Gemmataceae bacterium]